MRLAKYSLITLIGCLTGPALAHHPTGGGTPETIGHGLLSGVGHPLVGIEHLMFLLGLAGVASLINGHRVGGGTMFVMTTVLGSLIHVSGLSLPWPHVVVSVSIIGAGVFLAMRWQPPRIILSPLGGLAGLWHGFAYGEAVIGAEPAVVGAYLVGLASIQGGVLIVATTFLYRLRAAWPDGTVSVFRVAGSALFLFGAGFAVFG